MIQKVVTARLPNDVYSALVDKSKAEGRSLSVTIALVLSESLNPGSRESGEATGETADCSQALKALAARVTNLDAAATQQGAHRKRRKGKRRR